MRKFVIGLMCALALASCGSGTSSGKWEGKLIQGPGARPIDQKVYLVQDGKRRWVVHAEWLTAHGYAWPGDVHHVSAEEVDAIPAGDTILTVK